MAVFASAIGFYNSKRLNQRLEHTIAKNRNTFAKRQRELEKKQRSDDKRLKRERKRNERPGSTAGSEEKLPSDQ